MSRHVLLWHSYQLFWSQATICAMLIFLRRLGFQPHECEDSFEMIVPCDACGAGL